MDASAVIFYLLLMGFFSRILCQDLARDDLVTPSVVTGVECQDITLTCQLTGTSLSLSSLYMFSWSKEGGASPTADRDAFTIGDCTFGGVGDVLYPDKYEYAVAQDNTSCNLTIKSALRSDSACYRCDMFGHSGTAESFVEVVVIESVRSVSVKQLSPWIVENVPATFACSAGYGDGEVRATWLLDGTIVRDGTETDATGLGRPSVDCQGRNETIFTVVLALGRHNAGSVLECEVLTDRLLKIKASLQIPDILVPPTSVKIFDRNTGQLYNTSGMEALVTQHENATFNCLVEDTRPAANVSWFFRGLAVTGSEGSAKAVTQPRGDGTSGVLGTVVLPGLAWPDDGAELVCRAEGAGQISVSLAIRIRVDAPPQNVTLSSGVASENALNVFVCSAGRSRTASSMVWYLDDVNVTAPHNTSYSPERLQTTSVIALSLHREQTGSRLRCDVQHRLLQRPLTAEVTLDVNFCTLPSLSCPAVMNTSEPYGLTCRTPGGRPPANLSLYLEAPLKPLSAGYQLQHRPAAGHRGMATVLTANLTGRREDHGRTVVCRRIANEICPDEEFDRCQLSVHFPPMDVQFSEGSNPNANSLLGKRVVEVFDGREYSFTCGATGSNPAAAFRWVLASSEVQGAAYAKTAVGPRGRGGWNATSRLSLVVHQDTHHSQKLACEVLYPAGSQTVYRELNLEFSVIADVGMSWTMVIVIIACSGAVIVVVTVCLLVTLCNKTTRRGARLNSSVERCTELRELKGHRGDSDGGDSLLSFQGIGGNSPAGSEAYEFPREKLVLREVVGSGSYGLVYKATAEGIYEKRICSTVAVKTPNPSGSPTDREDFLKELEMFTILVQHPNVVSMLGYCRKRDPVYLIMEYVPNGNLENHLRREKQRVDQGYTNLMDGPTESIGPTQILGFAIQIARGMRYLSSVQCIHRDLATRNILLDDHFVCKVSDFGLARHVPVQKQYEMKSEGRVPFRWMAPESILSNVYTTKSDVWSFGVLLWELVTLGSHPYPGLSCSEILEDLKKGLRLQKPTHCSDEIYQLMKDCWEGKPEARPDFETLHTRIEAMLSNASGYLLMTNFKTEQYVYMAPGSN